MALLWAVTVGLALAANQEQTSLYAVVGKVALMAIVATYARLFHITARLLVSTEAAHKGAPSSMPALRVLDTVVTLLFLPVSSFLLYRRMERLSATE
ncbi:hypothetical protein [Azospirillum sp. B4]|uniref:hypothetical protein n=1 Tax=Azospirillum sp. B4 TaxID=95605 RepID=UPI0011DC9728|nr:hypothetical protein [Azospirillum sp. B4]